MEHILDRIVAQKRLEIKALYEQYDLGKLRCGVQPADRKFYRRLAAARAAGEPFFITEFKRKSPSEGWINRDAKVSEQVAAYAAAGAQAISVLTDHEFFGGSYEDLRQACLTLCSLLPSSDRPLLLQKDFILDPIQIYLARQHGADIILLIAAILEPEQLDFLKKTAESLGMGVLVEVHDLEELERIRHLDFPVLGVNNRDLKTFRTALNRVNVIAPHAGGRFLIAESGVKNYRDFQVVRAADGFLIGTGLMQKENTGAFFSLARHFQTTGRLLFKACGIRTPELLQNTAADFLGVNFSPVSNRRVNPEIFKNQAISHHAVAVFFKNSETEIRETLARYPFNIVQLYADDVSPGFVRSLPQKVFLAARISHSADLNRLETFAADVDPFILDGPQPGSGQPIEACVPENFPFPFLLAGGLHAGNLERVLCYRNCLGVDIASGIETDGRVDPEKINAVGRALKSLNLTSTIA